MIFAMEGFVHLRKTGMLSAFIAISCIVSSMVVRQFLPDNPFSLSDSIDAYLQADTTHPRKDDGSGELKYEEILEACPWFFLAIPTGIIWGFMGILLIRLTMIIRLRMICSHRPWRNWLALSGLFTGLAGVILRLIGSEIWGTCYHGTLGTSDGCVGHTPSVLWGSGDISILRVLLEQGSDVSSSALFMPLALAFAKLVACAVATAAAGVGGLYIPAVMIGASSGYAFGRLFSLVLSSSYPIPVYYACLGVSAMFGSVMRRPITGVLVAHELSSAKYFSLFESCVVFPMLLATMIAYFVSVQLQPDSLCYIMMAEDGFNVEKVKQMVEHGQTDWKRASTVLHDAPALRLTVPNAVQKTLDPVKELARRMTVRPATLGRKSLGRLGARMSLFHPALRGSDSNSMSESGSAVPGYSTHLECDPAVQPSNSGNAGAVQSMAEKVMNRAANKHSTIGSRGSGQSVAGRFSAAFSRFYPGKSPSGRPMDESNEHIIVEEEGNKFDSEPGVSVPISMPSIGGSQS